MAIGTPVSIGSVNNAVSGGTITVTGSATGDLVVVGVRLLTALASVTSITDDVGNSYVVAITEDVAALTGAEIWYATNTIIPATITVNITAGNFDAQSISASGIKTSSPVDKTAVSTSAVGVTTLSFSTGTLSQANELIVGFASLAGSSGAWTPSTGWTSFTTATAARHLEWEVVSATTTQTWNPSWVTARTYDAVIATFMGAATLPTGLVYDLSIPPPQKRLGMSELSFIHIFDRALLSGKDKFYGPAGMAVPVPRWDVPMGPVRSRYLMDAQEQRNRVVGHETLPRFVADLSAPLPQRRSRSLEDSQVQRAQYIPGRETLPGFVADLSTPPPQRRQDFHRQTQAPENRAPLLIGQERLPRFVADLSAPPPQRRQIELSDTQEPKNRMGLLIGQETLPKFNATWEVPQPARRQTQLSDIQEAKNRILLLVGQEQLPDFIADLRVMIPPARARDYLEALGQGNLAYLTPPIPPAPAAPVVPTVVGGAYDDPRNVPSATNLLPGELPGPLIRRAEAYRMDREPETGFPQPEQPPATPEPDYREDMGELPALPPVEPILAKMQRLEETALIRKALEFKLKRQLDDDEVIAILLMSL